MSYSMVARGILALQSLAVGAAACESDQRGRSGAFALMGILVLVVGLIVAMRAIVVGLALRTMFAPVVPFPAIAVLPVHITLVVAESPCVLLLEPVALAALIPVVACRGRVVPSPAIAVLPVFIAPGVAKSPGVLLLNPLTLAALIPLVWIGSDQTGRQHKRTEQNYHRY